MPMTLIPRRPTLRRLAALLLAATLPLTAADAHAAPVAADWILSRIARPAPMRTPFVELRGSALLKTPLRIAGEYQRPDAHTLVRDVRSPYAETTTIASGTGGGGDVTIARAGKSPRRFALARAPELAALQASFGALLAGDRAQLEQHYRIGAAGMRERWTLTLTPRDAALAAKVQGITLYGRGAELRCIETQMPKQPLQRTLLAGAARAATEVHDAAALAALCHGRGA
ncbi:LolA-related protein [Lysobacter korlensis]|uniref:LolA-related protein n=1 Tax=Lysobacter korlensis TaxID=553636 RepID=A0ABV6RIE8_9GAMM